MALNSAQLGKLFTSSEQKIVSKGSIVAFTYRGQTNHRIHDPYPLVLVSDIFVDMVRGVNLHYLTLPAVKSMVQTMTVSSFSYSFIKPDSYIVGAFRSYKRAGILNLRLLDVTFLKNLLTVVRSLDPGEIEQMRHQIQELLKTQINQPLAEET